MAAQRSSKPGSTATLWRIVSKLNMHVHTRKRAPAIRGSAANQTAPGALCVSAVSTAATTAASTAASAASTTAAASPNADQPVFTRHLLLLLLLVLLGGIFWQQAAATITGTASTGVTAHSTHPAPTSVPNSGPKSAPTQVTGIDVASSETFALDEAGTGMLYWQANQGFVNSPLLRSDIRVDVTGPVATTTFIQTFQHPDNGEAFADSHWLEGIYVFPLPEDAALRQLHIQVGERIIEGVIQERQQAREVYRQAADSGQIASIVEQQRPNLMQLRVANIAPGEAVTVTLSYLQSPAWEQQRYSLRIPMTLTPRYINARVTDAASISAAQLPADTAARLGQLPLADIRVVVAAAEDSVAIDSTSHAISQHQHHDHTEVQVAGPVPMDRDFLLSWQPAGGATPQLQYWQQATATERFLLAMIIPALDAGDQQPPHTPEDASLTPAHHATVNAQLPQGVATNVARELILVIDTSGSMGGESIRAARLALDQALLGLATEDYFNVIEFNSTASALFHHPVPANDTNIRRARQYTSRLQADGGTEMAAALELALNSSHSARLRQVVFITDGSVGDESFLLRRITRQLGQSRLFTVGIGTAPNTFFMHRAAHSGRGTYTYIAEVADVYDAMDTLFAKLSQPALTDITAEWLGGGANLATDPIPDIYYGEPLNLVAKIDDAVTGVILRGRHGSQRWQQTVQLPSPFSAAPHPSGQATVAADGGAIDAAPSTDDSLKAADHAIPTLWAREKIADLRDRQRLSTQPEAFRHPITRLALEHQLVSPYTSLVATDQRRARPASEPMLTGQVTQLMPAGSTGMTLSLPAGAAGSDTLLLLSLLSATLAVVLLWLRRYLLVATPVATSA